MFSAFIFTFFLVLYSKPALSQYAVSQGVDGQFITYSGLISGLFRHPQGLIDQGCPDYNLGPHNRSYIYIGQVRDDPNPFFFELYHYSSDYRGSVLSFTSDSIFNLDFTSYSGGADNLDLGIGTGQRRAVIERVQIDGTMGYKVSGDQMSFIGNGLIPSLVDIARPYGLVAPTSCMDEERYKWNSSFPFTYSLTFTQTSASMSLYSNATQGALTLSFVGTMNGTGVELFTTDPNVPKFNISFPLPSYGRSGGRESRHIVSLKIYAIGILGISLLM